jgi:hypothetical protein
MTALEGGRGVIENQKQILVGQNQASLGMTAWGGAQAGMA